MTNALILLRNCLTILSLCVISAVAGESAFAQEQAKKVAAQSAAINTDDILRRVDAIRCPESSFVMEVEIDSKRKDDFAKLEVFIKGRDKTRINTILPERDRKRGMIMKGDDVWVYVPNLKKSVLVSMSQRLAGETALADITRMRWWQDYTAELESEDSSSLTLLLQATRKKLAYRQIKVQVEKETFKPIQSEYLSPSGRVLKRAKFGGYKTIAGASRPTQIVFENVVVPSKSSTLRIIKIEEKEIPEKIFDEKNLGRL